MPAGSAGKSKRAVSALDLLVYAVGALKNVSNNAANQKILSQQGAFAALSSVMQVRAAPTTAAARPRAAPTAPTAAAACLRTGGVHRCPLRAGG